MCTVTAFLDNQKFILTSNRDISLDRTHSIPPKQIEHNDHPIIYPIDPDGKGTWIGASKYFIASLLNNEGRERSGLDSRGILIRNILSMEFKLKNLKNESKLFNPYILILFNTRTRELIKYSWDGIDFKIERVTSSYSIWTSNTIYSKEAALRKRKIFLDCTKRESSAEDILKFHLKSENILNSDIKTTSVTQICYQKNSDMKYRDLINNQDYFLKLSI